MQMEINGVQQISSNRQKGPRRLQEKRLCPYLRQWISTWVSARRRRWFLPFWFVVQLHAKLVARRSAGKETNNRWRPGADMKGDDLMWFVMVAAASEGLRCGCCGSIGIIWAKQGATHGIYMILPVFLVILTLRASYRILNAQLKINNEIEIA
jgi:hypothetical protein